MTDPERCAACQSPPGTVRLPLVWLVLLILFAGIGLLFVVLELTAYLT